jgi:hypothetical protein
MSPNSSRGIQLPSPGPRVHGNRLADDKAIADEFANSLAGIGVRDLVDFVGVEPDLALAAADDGGGKAFLGAEIDPDGLMEC